ncbi:hypothetical protein [Clostridium guangxiense]|uniref:hypothetical protein n=2 Tax=Clostridium TaxID=1485 RepID=UPI001E4920C0|nr:hypothetical protein [Clostridium guangxiense]MCD2346717.1 hypothetical protein [Clostridium guangxiense]
MGIHQFNINSLSDDEFVNGEVKYIVKKNQCRLLDGRRTPGYIEDYFEDTAMFRWRIIDFEDKGNYWDLPVEDIKSFQILKNSEELDMEAVDRITEKINFFNKSIVIQADIIKKEMVEEKINIVERNILNWFKDNSNKLLIEQAMNLNSEEGNKELIKDIKRYMKSIEMDCIEEKTSSEIVLNPNSEWLKGIKIILAKLGIVNYKNKILRDEKIFDNMGGEKRIIEYIINRIAYVRSYFKMLNIDEVILYRGMSTEREWINCYEKSLTSWTFSLEVALSFADLDKNNKYKNGYVIKRTVPIENIFMTYLETESMNKQYKECEAILFFDNEKGYY